MSLKTMTEEQKRLAFMDYNNREIKAAEIRRKYNLSSRDMANLILQFGGEFRKPALHHPKTTTKIKTCPKCKQKINLKGAKFCPFCATDIRNEAEILSEKIKKLLSVIMLLPDSARDEAQGVLLELKNYIERGK